MEQYRKVFPIEDVQNCLICNFDNPIFKFYGSDDRFGYPGEFPVVECPKCGLGYLAKRIKEEYIGELYDHYYRTRSKIGISNVPGFWRSYLKKIPFLLFLYNNIFRSSYNLYDYLKFKKNIRVLDVGSGFIPDKAKEIIKQHGHWIAVEVDSEISRSLRKQGLPVYCGTLEEYLETKPQSFDYIILSQIIEHIYNPKKFLRIVRSLLSRGGKVILSCPNYDSFLKETIWSAMDSLACALSRGPL